MTDAIEVEIAGVPVAKGRPRRAARPIGGRPTPTDYTPAKTRNYENPVKLEAGHAMAGRAPLEGVVTVTVIAYLPIPQSWSGKRKRMAAREELSPAKRPDLDNYIKAALDGCNKTVFADDAQIVELFSVKTYSACPRLRLRVAPYEPAGQTP